MASLSKDKNGSLRIEFTDSDGTRKRIRLGKMPLRDARSIKTKIEGLIASQRSTLPWDAELAAWVGKIPDELADRISRTGLIPERESNEPDETLGEFIDNCIERRAISKPNTLRNYRTTRRLLVEHFGADRRLTDISPGDADEWREALLKRLSNATVGREVKRARQFFEAAKRKRLISDNPFADVSAPSQVNTKRSFFVSNEVIERVLDACPDDEYRLIVVLCRYGGFRCPSEILLLKWSDVNWERAEITISSPKTEHHAGGNSRIIPMFPELKPYLESLFFDEQHDGSDYVITRYRKSNANLRTQFARIIERAGVEPWPKLFHNLRASRQTELTAEYALHVVCRWLGNSQPVADKHYLQVTEEHYRKATQNVTSAKVARIAARQLAETSCSDVQTKTANPEKHRGLPLVAAQCEALQDCVIPPRGVEPLLPD